MRDFSSYHYKDLAAIVKDGIISKSNNRTVELKFPMIVVQLLLKKTIDWAQDQRKMGEPQP